jgi:hypothetical protein
MCETMKVLRTGFKYGTDSSEAVIKIGVSLKEYSSHCFIKSLFPLIFLLLLLLLLLLKKLGKLMTCSGLMTVCV